MTSQVSLIKGTARTSAGSSRRVWVLGSVSDIDCYMIEEEIASRMARQVDSPQAEAGVVEVPGAPCAARRDTLVQLLDQPGTDRGTAIGD
jgi:hypothetical protein